MASTTYTLRPLNWRKTKPSSYQQRYEATTPFGSFFVERYRENWEDNAPWETWKWGYCFDEYYDEHFADCESSAEGKEMAQKEWDRRMIPCLKLASAATTERTGEKP